MDLSEEICHRLPLGSATETPWLELLPSGWFEWLPSQARKVRTVFSPVSSFRGSCEEVQLWLLVETWGRSQSCHLSLLGLCCSPWAAAQSSLPLVFHHCHFGVFSISDSRLGPVVGRSFRRPGKEFDCLYLSLHCGNKAVHVFQSLNDTRMILLNKVRSLRP